MALSGKRRMAVALTLLLNLGFLGSAVTPTSVAAQDDCGDSLQQRINAAPNGATLDLPNCIYRESVRIDKPLTLNGAAGTEIRGSDRWTSWSGSGPFTSNNSLPPFPTETNSVICLPNNQRCYWPEQVFIDGAALEQVASNPESGQFAVNGQRRVILADDPNGRTVEVTVRREWVVVQANGVRLRNLGMRHAATAYDSAALRSDSGATDWELSDSELAYAASTLVRPYGARLLRNDLHHGGKLGIASAGEIRNNRIHHNNTEGFDPGWEAGGMKAFRASDWIADGNLVYENHGNGLWCDAGCRNVTLSNNTIYDNYYFGILYELSQDAKVFNNSVWGNGEGYPFYGGGAGIMLSTTARVEVYDNTVAWNGGGIHFLSWNRGSEFPLGNNSAHGNVIAMGKDGYALGFFEGTANNSGWDNSYWYPDAENGRSRFDWGQSFSALNAFNGSQGEEHGRYLSDGELSSTLSSRGVPTTPGGEIPDGGNPSAPEPAPPAQNPAPAPVNGGFLSDRDWVSATNGWGPVERDRSTNERAEGDGRRMQINGILYDKGLGVHSHSDIRYSLGGGCTTFSAYVGVDDEIASLGSVVFQVYLDGAQAFDSGRMTSSDPARTINLTNLSGKQELRLVVTDAGDGNARDHGNWADARVGCR